VEVRFFYHGAVFIVSVDRSKTESFKYLSKLKMLTLVLFSKRYSAC
jgi:hypothetical protein